MEWMARRRDQRASGCVSMLSLRDGKGKPSCEEGQAVARLCTVVLGTMSLGSSWGHPDGREAMNPPSGSKRVPAAWKAQSYNGFYFNLFRFWQVFS